MASHNFDHIDTSPLLYQPNDELLNHTMLTPFSEQKFDLLDSKTDDAPYAYDGYNSLGIYDQYNDSGPSSVQFGDGIEASEHGGSHINGNDGGMNGNVRLTDLHDVPDMDGPPLPLSPSYRTTTNGFQTNGTHNSSAKANGIDTNGGKNSNPVKMAISKNTPSSVLDSITVRG